MGDKNNFTHNLRSVRFRLSRYALGLLQLAVLLSLVTASVQGAPAAGRASAPEASPVVFTSESVEGGKYFHWMSDRSLRLDSNKRPHIVYGGNKLYYAYFDGSVWKYEIADANYGVGRYASLVLDSDNKPHVSYYDARNRALKYARKTGAAWEVFTVDAPPGIMALSETGEGFNADADLPIESSLDFREWRFSIPGSGDAGSPQDLEDPALGEEMEAGPYLQEAEVELESEPPDEIQDGDVSDEAAGAPDVSPGGEAGLSPYTDDYGRGLYTSIAVNAFGNPVISYYDSINGDLKVAFWNDSLWDLHTADAAGDVGRYSSLALDSSGYPHVSYYDASGGDLKYIRWTGSAWTGATAIDSGGNVGLYTSLAVDKWRNPHISYYDITNGDLKYARVTDGKWVVIRVDTPGDVGLHTSIAVDGSSVAYISYYNATYADLKYARCAGSSCGLQTVLADGFTGRYTAIALDGASPRISFYESSSGQLKYAYRAETNWVVATIDYSLDVGLFASMELDTNGRPSVAYFDDINDDLRYAYHDGSAWKFGKLDAAGEVGLYTSLALDKTTNRPHISYYDASHKRLKYTTWKDTAWSLQVVDYGPDAGTYSSIALDSAGNPRIAYCRGKGCTTRNPADKMDLRVALYLNGEWHVMTADHETVGMYASIAVDQDNYVHVSYYDSAKGQLKYVKGTSDGMQWDPEVVDSSPKVGMFTSIALDSAGRPHIAYFDDYYDRLKYAYWDGSVWRTTVVDSQGSAGGNPSIKVDSSGVPHISYYDFSNEMLKYAFRSGPTAWYTTIANNDGEVGYYSSLALKDGLTPVIAYYSATTGELKYASSMPAKLNFLPMISR